MLKHSVLAADLGGTKCRFALVDQDLAVHGARTVPTERTREGLLGGLDGALAALAVDPPDGVAPPRAIGIGVAAVVRPDGDTLEGGPNLPLEGMRLGSHLRRRHGLPATLLNDGRASALGEYLRGAARGCDPLLVLFFGTGIGIGLIVAGQPYRGASNAAGEVGHLLHRPDGRRCPCGRCGCYEAYCGGGPMTARAAAEVGPPPAGAAAWTVGALVAAARDDHAAMAILADAETAAGAMVASLCTLLNPAAVVLGGGVLSGWPDLATRIEAFVRGRCTRAVTESLAFKRSMGGSDAVLWGAASATGCW